MMGKALSGELSCPCDRSCYIVNDHYLRAWLLCVCVGGGGGGTGNKEGKLVVHVFLSTSGPISN